MFESRFERKKIDLVWKEGSKVSKEGEKVRVMSENICELLKKYMQGDEGKNTHRNSHMKF